MAECIWVALLKSIIDPVREALSVQFCSIPVILLVTQSRHSFESVPLVRHKDGHTESRRRDKYMQFWQSKDMSTIALVEPSPAWSIQ